MSKVKASAHSSRPKAGPSKRKAAKSPITPSDPVPRAIEARTAAVNLRVQVDTRNLIDQAAQSVRQTRSQFMIEAARRAAEETLLDRAFVRVDEHTYAAFLDVLDQPPPEAAFARLMSAAKPWKD